MAAYLGMKSLRPAALLNSVVRRQNPFEAKLFMTSLELLARVRRQYERGLITAAEFATTLSDSFAGDPNLQTKDAAAVAALIPPEAIGLVKQQIDASLSSGYMRQAFAMGGRSRTKEEERAAALCETAREQAWAAALKPLLS